MPILAGKVYKTEKMSVWSHLIVVELPFIDKIPVKKSQQMIAILHTNIERDAMVTLKEPCDTFYSLLYYSQFYSWRLHVFLQMQET